MGPDVEPMDVKNPAVAQSGLNDGLGCVWCQDGDKDSDTWATQCGHYFVLNDGTPKENNLAFCCYCGGILEQILQGE